MTSTAATAFSVHTSSTTPCVFRDIHLQGAIPSEKESTVEVIPYVEIIRRPHCANWPSSLTIDKQNEPNNKGTPHQTVAQATAIHWVR